MRSTREATTSNVVYGNVFPSIPGDKVFHDCNSPQDFNRVLWPKSAPLCLDFPKLSTDRTVDVAIIGGGYTGLSAALHLAGARSVALLEAREPGFGSSGRNGAGFMAAYLDQTPDDIIRRLGQDRGDALNRMVATSPELVRDIIDQYSIDADLRTSGVLIGAHDRRSSEGLSQLAQMWRRYGSVIEDLSEGKMAELTGSAKFHGGLLFKQAGTINPISYSRGLASAAQKSGAEIYVRSTAEKLFRDGQFWIVQGSGGNVRARHVLLATDAYAATTDLWPALERSYYAIPVGMIASEPMPERVREFLREGIPVSDGNKTNHFWLMATPEGRLVASMLPPCHDEMTANRAAAPFESKLRRIFGDFAPIQWDHYWIGQVAVTAGRHPCAFDLAVNLHGIGGYCGQGITAATAAGREYAKFILSGGDKNASDLPFTTPSPVPMRKLMPVMIRKVLAPLSRAMDTSYR